MFAKPLSDHSRARPQAESQQSITTGQGAWISGARLRAATAPPNDARPRCYHPGTIRRYTLLLLRITLRRFSPPQNPNLKRPTGSLNMNMQTKMQDIVGLTKVAPLSRRGFMTASAASAAGFTLAAGPVRADAIKTDTAGLTAGDAKVAVAGGGKPG